MVWLCWEPWSSALWQHFNTQQDGCIFSTHWWSLRWHTPRPRCLEKPHTGTPSPTKNISYSIITKSQITIEKTIPRFLGILHSLLWVEILLHCIFYIYRGFIPNYWISKSHFDRFLNRYRQVTKLTCFLVFSSLLFCYSWVSFYFKVGLFLLRLNQYPVV